VGDLSDAPIVLSAQDAGVVNETAMQTKEIAMPLINVKVMENVLTADQKQDLATRFTDSFAAVVGEPVRPLTWVIIEDITSGQLVIGGDSITTDAVKELLGTPKAAVASR
jgi:4-oxalocrotonate tautomerase